MKVLIGSAIVAIILIISSCVFVAGTHKHPNEDHPDCPVCDESYASDEHLAAHCATNFEAPKDPLQATKCLTCGIHFTHPAYGEHIKTCCP